MFALPISLAEQVHIYEQDETVGAFVQALTNATHQCNIRQFTKLAGMLSNTWWCHVNDVDPKGNAHAVYLTGFRKAGQIAFDLFKKSELYHSFTDKSSFYSPEQCTEFCEGFFINLVPHNDDNGASCVKLFEEYNLYLHSEIKSDQEICFWYTALHSSGFRILNTKQCDEMINFRHI